MVKKHGLPEDQQIARLDTNHCAKGRFRLDLADKSELIRLNTMPGASLAHVHRDQETDRAGDRTCSFH